MTSNVFDLVDVFAEPEDKVFIKAQATVLVPEEVNAYPAAPG